MISTIAPSHQTGKAPDPMILLSSGAPSRAASITFSIFFPSVRVRWSLAIDSIASLSGAFLASRWLDPIFQSHSLVDALKTWLLETLVKIASILMPNSLNCHQEGVPQWFVCQTQRSYKFFGTSLQDLMVEHGAGTLGIVPLPQWHWYWAELALHCNNTSPVPTAAAWLPTTPIAKLIEGWGSARSQLEWSSFAISASTKRWKCTEQTSLETPCSTQKCWSALSWQCPTRWIQDMLQTKAWDL